MNDLVKELSSFFYGTWYNTSKEFPVDIPVSDYSTKKQQEKFTDKFIDDFLSMIKNFPAEENLRLIWKERFKTSFYTFISRTNLFTPQDKSILFNNGLVELSEEFVTKAKAFDKTIGIEDITQGIRNVWIMNILQMLLSMQPSLTSAIFGYSMLYPYTDNFLDASTIAREEKAKINDHFGQRLKGIAITPENSYETSIFSLVTEIENTFKRDLYPKVYESLLCIHNGQIKSILQHEKNISPYETDILGISIEKGGSSVLADAYLIKGDLTTKEAYFFFGYGFMLQLCDDLQDVIEDYKLGNMTIVSQTAYKWPLDKLTNRIINFTLDFLQSMDNFNAKNIEEIKELIRKNCLQLIYFSIAKNKALYSKEYFNRISSFFTYTPNYMNTMGVKLKRKYSNLKESYGGLTTDKIVLFALKDI